MSEQIRTDPPKPEGARVIVSRYDGRCAACNGKILRGDVVAYSPEARRGRKVKHPECYGSDVEVIAIRAAEEAAKEARERILVSLAEGRVRGAEQELEKAVKSMFRVLFGLVNNPETKGVALYATHIAQREVAAERKAAQAERTAAKVPQRHGNVIPFRRTARP